MSLCIQELQRSFPESCVLLCQRPRIRQISWSIDIPIVIDAAFLHNIQICYCSSGYVNVFKWNREWFLSRRVKFDSGFNVMAVYAVSWRGPKVVYRFTGIRKRVLRWWRKRRFWFSKKVNITLSLNWSMPYQGGCSQFLISSRGFDSSICDWKNKFSLFGKYHRVFASRFPMRPSSPTLKVCDQYVTLPNSPRVESVSEEQSRWDFLSKLMDSWLILRSYRVILNQWTKWNNRYFKWLPNTSFVFPSDNKSVTFRR